MLQKLEPIILQTRVVVDFIIYLNSRFEYDRLLEYERKITHSMIQYVGKNLGEVIDMNLQQTKELTTYLEIRRTQFQLTQEAFVSGIVSVRQYRRYLRGLSLISETSLIRFAHRLEMTSDQLMIHFEEIKSEQKKAIHDLHNAIVNYDYKEASLLRQKISRRYIILSDSRLVYAFALLLEKFQLKKISSLEVMKQIIDLVGYPEVLNASTLSSATVLVVSSLMSYPEFKDQEKLIERLMTYLKQTELIHSSQIDRNYVLTLFRISRYRGVQEDYQNVIEICDLGIQYSLDRMSMYMLDYFYYFKALSFHKLNDMKNYEDMVFKCYTLVHSIEFVMEYIKQKRLGQ
jgi:hypothetical protein